MSESSTFLAISQQPQLGMNHSRFSALATLYSISTEIRQVKPSRFQTRTLKKFSNLYIKENQGLKFQFLLGDAKNCLDSSVSYYQAREQRFWAYLKTWEQMPKASPSPILVS